MLQVCQFLPGNSLETFCGYSNTHAPLTINPIYLINYFETLPLVCLFPEY